MQTLVTYLANGRDIDVTHPKIGTLLMSAIAHGQFQVVDALLQKGADVNIAHPDLQVTALHVATAGNDTSTVQKLIAFGADLEARDNQGWTPLMFATQSGNAEMVRELLQQGASIDPVDSIGRTVLMQASVHGKVEIASQLLEAGSQINQACGWATPLIMAATAGHTGFAEFAISNGADVDFLDAHDGYSALMMAAMGGHTSTVNALLENGADANLTTEWHVTALTMARRGSHSDVEARLQQAGAREPQPVAIPVRFPWGLVGDPILCQQMKDLMQ